MNENVVPEDGTVRDLQSFILQFIVDEEGSRLEFGDYFFCKEPHFHDVNREVVAPGESEDAPDGGVGIRGDWDFWILAYIPYRFRNLSCAEIAGVIWPEHADKLDFLPDSGAYWWTAKSDDSLEVPGESFEVWALCHYTDGHEPDYIRLDTYPTEEEARTYIRKQRPSPDIEHEIRVWQDGERKPVA